MRLINGERKQVCNKANANVEWRVGEKISEVIKKRFSLMNLNIHWLVGGLFLFEGDKKASLLGDSTSLLKTNDRKLY